MKGKGRGRSPEIALLRREKSISWLEAKLGHLEAVGRRMDTATELTRHAARYMSGLVSFAHETYGQIAFASGVVPLFVRASTGAFAASSNSTIGLFPFSAAK